jgi:hypothetical protein
MPQTIEPELDKWTEEEVEVTNIVPKFDDKGNVSRFESETSKVSRKTILLREETVFKECEDHYWELVDNNRSAFECNKCRKGCIAHPWEYEWNDGKLTKV